MSLDFSAEVSQAMDLHLRSWTCCNLRRVSHGPRLPHDASASLPPYWTSGCVLPDPPPSEVDPRALDIVLFGYAVLEVLLRHTLHGHEVPTGQHHSPVLLLALLGPVCAQLKLPPHAEGQGEDANVLELALEEPLIICMPADRHTAILVEVHIAASGPIVGRLDAAIGHDLLHEVHHPGGILLRLHLDAPVAVGASATLFHHPGRLPGDGALGALGLLPARALAHAREVVGAPLL
mmetsp:Transcript_106857/g.312368  ORF Transcript_106857/g.312368 Transcript_106857/m.312368 type:complete len:235 (-) Transcript_106857:588-1292(-)